VEVVDQGHSYLLDRLDGDSKAELVFVKRVGSKYPGNTSAYPGTNMQEVIRALLDRCRYLNNQIFCDETMEVIRLLRAALIQLELRAAIRHGRNTGFIANVDLENGETCPECGHLGCGGTCA